MSFSVRLLTPDDVAAYRDIRLEALRTEPTAFGSDLAGEAALTEAQWVERLVTSATFGLFEGGRLVGIATFVRAGGLKQRHRGNVFGVYVATAARGTGGGRQLMAALIAAVPDGVLQLHLTVTAGNVPARQLYESLGFRPYGTEPRALCIEGRYYDEDLMVLRLDAGSGK